MHIYHNYLYLVFFILVISCSEGDIIEDNIDNFDTPVKNCSNENNKTYVFYKTDSKINRSLSIAFKSETFKLDTIPKENKLTIALDGKSNTFIFRTYNDAIDGESYFCSSIPPDNDTVVQELTSNDGTVEITYTLKSENETAVTYTRNIVLYNITLKGGDIAMRQELFDFGSDQITILK